MLALVWLYQHSLGKLIGGNCRFSPSCSTFAATALRRHGASGGLWLIVRRLMRCHPWYTGSPIDPVPEKFHGVEIAG